MSVSSKDEMGALRIYFFIFDFFFSIEIFFDFLIKFLNMVSTSQS